MDPEYREKVIADAYRVDSMAEVLQKQTKYVSVIRAIVSGDMPAELLKDGGEKILLDTVSLDNLDKIKASREEEMFREEYEEKEKDNLSTLAQHESKPDFLFYKPVKGKIKSRYNPTKKEYGMDFAIDGKQAVLSVLDGTVIFASYVAEYQYVIHVQHLNDFVSVYKFNSELIKKEGDRVKAGEVIAVISETSDTKNQNHLYFELWQKGFALNPEDYILF
jgi:lipoprotein NlpD